MKTCPNCKEEVDDNFDLCWNCNYSFSENKVATVRESDQIEFDKKEESDLKCLRCNSFMRHSGNYKFHEGARTGIFGWIGEAFVNRESFDLYICPNCGKVEFFTPI